MTDNKKQPFLSFFGGGNAGAQEQAQDSEPPFNWPTMFEESKEMMEVSILIYALTDLRALWRMGKLSKGDQELLALPLSPTDAMTAVKNNLEVLKETFGATGADYYTSSLAAIQQSMRHQSIDPVTGEAVLESTELVAFDDDNIESELVYGIAVNSVRKRITIGFRGSVTISDFITDANSVLVERANPIEGKRGNIGIHNGFHDYLYGNKKAGGDNKCDKIMLELVELLQKYPGFKIYSTGHSLGAALSTLFAFEAAADPRMPKPISCINIASPKCGNLSFRRAFQALEKSRQIRCLRIANHKDIVTLLPDRGSLSCIYIMCCQSNVYRHVGMELKLFSAERCSILKTAESSSYFGIFFRDWKRQVKNSVIMVVSLPFICCCREDFLKYHGCDEYMERIVGNSRRLEYESLNGLYVKQNDLKASAD